MASNTPRTRFYCNHSGCQRSYLRLEHLNRHTLTHKQRAFACYFCKRQFTRNDLLQVHLRRHVGRAMEIVERRRSQSPPHQGHRDELLRKSNALWEGNPLPLGLVGSPGFDPSMGCEDDIRSGTNNVMQLPVDNRRPSPDLRSNQVSSEHQRLLAEIPVRCLIQIVRDRLVINTSEICQETSEVLDRLLDDNSINSVFQE